MKCKLLYYLLNVNICLNLLRDSLGFSDFRFFFHIQSSAKRFDPIAEKNLNRAQSATVRSTRFLAALYTHVFASVLVARKIVIYLFVNVKECTTRHGTFRLMYAMFGFGVPQPSSGDVRAGIENI